MTDDLIEPLVEAMAQEGYYQMKPACYDSAEINPDKPTCLAGSPWVGKGHDIMGDAKHFKNPNVKMDGHDEFHRASSLFPFHHPEVVGNCSLTDTDCSFKPYSITENVYESLNDFTEPKAFRVSAWEMRTKYLSRQVLKISSGESDADFHANDEVEQNCAEVNQAAVEWALNQVPEKTKQRYLQDGQIMVQTDDRPQQNGGLWIIQGLQYTDKEVDGVEKAQIEISSLAYKMKVDFIISIFAGDHYCKLLSPFKAMEWIYVDSLTARKSLKSQSEEKIAEKVTEFL